jgi:fatty-acyl-CoA synthase
MHVPLSPIRCLYRAVDLYPQKTAVISGDRRFTYAQFGERCERAAAGLQSLGVQPADRVAYLSFNNAELLEGYYAPLLAGAITMPLNVRLSPAELTGILNHAEPRVVFYESDFAPTVDQLRRACPAVQHWIEIGRCYEELLAIGRLPRPSVFSVDESAIGELFYTSGSTGTPKGVTLSHRTLYMHAFAVVAAFAHTDENIELHTIPLFHANGWGRAHSSVMMGLTQVMVRRFEPATVLCLIESERANGMALVPTMANALLNFPDRVNYDLCSMKEIILGGAAASPELIARMEQAFPAAHVLAAYGLTESGPVASCARPKSTVHYADDDDRLSRVAMAGWPLPGCEIRVVDFHMNDVPRDMLSIGEVIIRGDLIMDGYYKEPKATAAVLTDGWLHTGDMAVWDAENFIHIVDRKKDIIISGGENISSIEVERAIFAHPAVLECAVVSAPDPQWGEVPAAYVVPKPGAALTQEELCAHLAGRIAKFKMPRRFEFLDTPLPKTGTGKIIKRELRESFWNGKDRRVQG